MTSLSSRRIGLGNHRALAASHDRLDTQNFNTLDIVTTAMLRRMTNEALEAAIVGFAGIVSGAKALDDGGAGTGRGSPCITLTSLTVEPNVDPGPTSIDIEVKTVTTDKDAGVTILFSALDADALGVGFENQMSHPPILISEPPGVEGLDAPMAMGNGVYYIGLTASVVPTEARTNPKTGNAEYTGEAALIGFELEPISVTAVGPNTFTLTLGGSKFLGATDAAQVDRTGTACRVYKVTPASVTPEAIYQGTIVYSGGRNTVTCPGLGEGAAYSTDPADYRVFIEGPVITDWDPTTGGTVNPPDGFLYLGKYEKHGTNPWVRGDTFDNTSPVMPNLRDLTTEKLGVLRGVRTQFNTHEIEHIWRILIRQHDHEVATDHVIEVQDTAGNPVFYVQADGTIWSSAGLGIPVDPAPDNTGARFLVKNGSTDGIECEATVIPYIHLSHMVPATIDKRVLARWEAGQRTWHGANFLSANSSILHIYVTDHADHTTGVGGPHIANVRFEWKIPLAPIIMHSVAQVFNKTDWQYVQDLFGPTDPRTLWEKVILTGLQVTRGEVGSDGVNDLNTMTVEIVRSRWSGTAVGNHAYVEEIVFRVDGQTAGAQDWPFNAAYATVEDTRALDISAYTPAAEHSVLPNDYASAQPNTGNDHRWVYFLRVIIEEKADGSFDLDATTGPLATFGDYVCQASLDDIRVKFRLKALEP